MPRVAEAGDSAGANKVVKRPEKVADRADRAVVLAVDSTVAAASNNNQARSSRAMKAGGDSSVEKVVRADSSVKRAAVVDASAAVDGWDDAATKRVAREQPKLNP